MTIRNRIFLSYVVLVGLFLAFLSAYVYLSVMRSEIDRDLTRLYQVKSSWGDMLIAMNDIVVNWNDGKSYASFVKRLDEFQNGLDYLRTSGYDKFYYPPLLRRHVRALYQIWLLAHGNILQIIHSISSTDFQRVVKKVTREPGLQRLNHLWVELYYQGTSKQRADAYVVRHVLDSVAFFPIYSSTMSRQFDIVLKETSSVYERVIHIQIALAISFFVLFLLGYFTFSFFFARSISRPIVDVSLRLSSFIGQSIERTSVAHRNEIELLDHSVTTLIGHYTDLSRIARTLADGDIENESPEFPKSGIVGSALGEISDYLHHMAQASAWIRDGKYGSTVELKSDKDVLGRTFNIMSSVVYEKITTLSRVFDSIEEGLLVIDADGMILESNHRLLELLELDSIHDLSSAGGLERFMRDYARFHRKLLSDGLRGNHSATMITAHGSSVPVRVTARSLEPIPGKSNTFMLFISNESWRVRMKREREQLKAQAVLAELKALRAQINPHFLFNTLNTIAQLVETTPDLAVDTIGKLADLFRYTLATTERETVLVADELKHIRDYIEIEQTRFEGDLSVSYAIDNTVESQSMPPMLLQPIVENALRHGKDDNGRVDLSIKAEWNSDDVVFRIADHGSTSELRDFYGGRGIGLKNVNNRLRTLYNNAIQIRPNEPRGVVVSVAIPGGKNGGTNAHSRR